MVIRQDLAAHNGRNAHLLGCLNVEDQSVKTVRVGQGEPVHVVLFSALAELF